VNEINSGIPNDWKLIKTYDMGDVEETIYSIIFYIIYRVMCIQISLLCYNTKGDISAITPNISKSIVEEVEVKIGRYVNRLLDLYFKRQRGKVAIGDYSYKRYKDREKIIRFLI
jgi:hypothetical protein